MNALNLCVSGLYANGPEYVPAAGKRRDLPYFRFPKSSSGLLQESDLYCFLGPFRFWTEAVAGVATGVLRV